jgi:hypothetical protein
MYTVSATQINSTLARHNHLPATARFREEQDDDAYAVIGVPFETPHSLRSLLLDHAANVMPDYDRGERSFKIRAADSFGHRSSASILLNRMYARRGYLSTGLPLQATPDRVTLTACEHEDTIGTITVGFDTPTGLNVDQLFRKEVDTLRQRDRKVCEFTKLAMDGVVKSKRVLASLFHVAYISAHRLKGVQNLLIEVNPRHVRYYERMLGFEVKSAERMNPRVNAPAVLLSLDFAHARAQIARFGGRPQLAAAERSLYPYFFSVSEEAAIAARLRKR